jgi:hypothetical protein
MNISFKNLWHEPLVHFLLIGAAIFVFYSLTRDVTSEAPNRIVVSSGHIEQLTANFKRVWMRPPSEEELNALVERHVREEVFYREAVAMGLDQNDPQVRQRMRMKLEYMLEDLSSQNVTDDDLNTFLEKHQDKFRSEAQLSFQQVYLNPDKRNDLEADAEQLLTRLNSGASPETVGDPTLVPVDYSLSTQSVIARSFGESFAGEVVKLIPGDWIGPVYSAYGGHLLKVSERVDARMPALNDIRAQVEREYLLEKSHELKELAYQKLRENYEVSVEPAASAPVASTQSPGSEIIATVQADEIQ